MHIYKYLFTFKFLLQLHLRWQQDNLSYAFKSLKRAFLNMSMIKKEIWHVCQHLLVQFIFSHHCSSSVLHFEQIDSEHLSYS